MKIHTCIHIYMCVLLMGRMHEYGVDKSDGSVVFGQLLGMSDHVTFPLGKLECE